MVSADLLALPLVWWLGASCSKAGWTLLDRGGCSLESWTLSSLCLQGLKPKSNIWPGRWCIAGPEHKARITHAHTRAHAHTHAHTHACHPFPCPRWLREQVNSCSIEELHDGMMPPDATVYEFCFDQKAGSWVEWMTTIPEFVCDPDKPFSEVGSWVRGVGVVCVGYAHLVAPRTRTQACSPTQPMQVAIA